jgi:hypothetical protein
MEITSIFSFLVHPGKHEDIQPDIGGVTIPLEGNLYYMLSSVFGKATDECNIDIAFTQSDDGSQYNNCRQEVVGLLKDKNLDRARIVAQRLQAVTTKRSGLGLLFIVLGSNETSERVYIARFPADFGIVAQEDDETLRVELLEQVFMKNAVSYKAVVFDGVSYDADFWVGKAVDKQISNNSVAISGYWIREFLLANFRTTPAQGTRRLAIAIKRTMDQTDDLEIKEELAAASRLARSLNGELLSMSNFGQRFGLSEKTQTALASTLSDPTLRFDQFRFTHEEFTKHVRFRSVQINNGALLTAPTGRFDECFTRQKVAENREEYTFTTQGTVINERLSKSSR